MADLSYDKVAFIAKFDTVRINILTQKHYFHNAF